MASAAIVRPCSRASFGFSSLIGSPISGGLAFGFGGGIELPLHVKGRPYPLCCSEEPHPAFANHLARTGRLAWCVDPTLDVQPEIGEAVDEVKATSIDPLNSLAW
jgi:hypothetical protein